MIRLYIALPALSFEGPAMISVLASILVLTTSPTTRLVDACAKEGTSHTECTCYAAFIEDHTTKRELSALATLAEPQNRDSLQLAIAALTKEGLSPSEIFSLGLKVENLTDEANAACDGK